MKRCNIVPLAMFFCTYGLLHAILSDLMSFAQHFCEKSIHNEERLWKGQLFIVNKVTNISRGCYPKPGLYCAIVVNKVCVLRICTLVASISLLFFSFSFLNSSICLCLSWLAAFSILSLSRNLATAALFFSVVLIFVLSGFVPLVAESLGWLWFYGSWRSWVAGILWWLKVLGGFDSLVAECDCIVWADSGGLIKQACRACCNVERHILSTWSRFWLQPFLWLSKLCVEIYILSTQENSCFAITLMRSISYLWHSYRVIFGSLYTTMLYKTGLLWIMVTSDPFLGR